MTTVLLVALTVAGCSAPARPSAPDPGDTLFGTNLWERPGESRAAALARLESTFGRLDVVRVFSPWLPPWWSDLDEDLGDRPAVVSFQVPPARILSGAADARLTRWFGAAPTNRDTWWVYLHEPEDDVEAGAFTAEEFRAAWSHVAALAEAVGNPRLHATVVLMCWTARESSGRDWRAYVPARGVDVLAWDCYAGGHDAATYADPEELLRPAHEAAAAVGAEWGIAELGARLGSSSAAVERAAWIETAGEYAGRHGARFALWFHAPAGGDFRLLDEPSARAWASLVEAS